MATNTRLVFASEKVINSAPLITVVDGQSDPGSEASHVADQDEKVGANCMLELKPGSQTHSELLYSLPDWYSYCVRRIKMGFVAWCLELPMQSYCSETCESGIDTVRAAVQLEVQRLNSLGVQPPSPLYPKDSLVVHIAHDENDEPKSLQINIRVTRTERDLLAEQARRAGVPLSKYILARSLGANSTFGTEKSVQTCVQPSVVVRPVRARSKFKAAGDAIT